jgi:phage/plasmid-like protein (TIGR03299 family)
MAHELSIRKNGKAEMAYVGETPWHGLGQQLREGASIEEWVTAAGMDWKLCRSRVRFGEGKNQLTWDDRVVLFRGDTKKPLSVVSKDYKPVQPRALLEFFRDLVEVGGFKLDTAGVLFDGRRMWAQALIGEEATIMGDDLVRGRLLLATACDGSMMTSGRDVAERVVCANTLGMAFSEKTKRLVKVPHSTHFNPDMMKAELGLARGNFKAFITAARTLAKKRMKNAAAEAFVAKLLVDSKTVTAKQDIEKAVLESTPFQTIMGLFKGSAMGGTLVSAEGTAWGALNAVTEFVDHHAKAASDSNRLDRAWFGAGDRLKTAAFAAALAL